MPTISIVHFFFFSLFVLTEVVVENDGNCGGYVVMLGQ